MVALRKRALIGGETLRDSESKEEGRGRKEGKNLALTVKSGGLLFYEVSVSSYFLYLVKR